MNLQFKVERPLDVQCIDQYVLKGKIDPLEELQAYWSILILSYTIKSLLKHIDGTFNILINAWM